MHTTQAHNALAALVRRATSHLSSPAVAVQLDTAYPADEELSADAKLSWDIENARIMAGDGNETALDLYQAAHPDEDAVFNLVRQPMGPVDTLSLDVTADAAAREMRWQEYEALRRPVDVSHVVF